MKTGEKLFITDFDRTLLTDDKTISREDIRTLEILRQKKIFTAIATGRSEYSFEKAIKDMGMASDFLPIDYVIFSTGAGIMEFPKGKVICQKALSFSDIRTIMDCLDQRKLDYMVHKAIPDTRYFLYKSHGADNPDFQARLALYNKYALPLETGDLPLPPATEVVVILRGCATMDFLEEIKKDLPLFSIIHATSPLDHQSSWIEIFHRDVSKSKAAAWLSKRLGIRRQDVISVGNDYNDQDLLAWSGNGFVVENAPASLRRVFKTVPSNNHSGVSEAVRQSGWAG